MWNIVHVRYEWQNTEFSEVKGLHVQVIARTGNINKFNIFFINFFRMNTTIKYWFCCGLMDYCRVDQREKYTLSAINQGTRNTNMTTTWLIYSSLHWQGQPIMNNWFTVAKPVFFLVNC